MLFGGRAFAQMSVHVGYLNSTLTASNDDPANSNGVYAGLTYNIPVAGGFGIAPGVYYSMIGSKVTQGNSSASITGTFLEHAVNVPVHLNYGIDLSRDTKVFLYGGPTVQYGLSSKEEYEGNLLGLGGNTYVDNYGDGRYTRTNVYLGGGVGLNAGGIMVTVGYDYGMMNLFQYDKDVQHHRSNLKIGVGYEF